MRLLDCRSVRRAVLRSRRATASIERFAVRRNVMSIARTLVALLMTSLSPLVIAAAVAFLTSPAAGYITGVNQPVDGGRIQAL